MGYKRRACVLFVCTGSACRSRIAETWANHLGGTWLEARSASARDAGEHPLAALVMHEAGVELPHQVPRVLTANMLAWADLVVALNEDADELCPAVPSGTQKRCWPLPDPLRTGGSEQAMLQAFRALREEIRERVEGMLGGMRLLARSGEEIHEESR